MDGVSGFMTIIIAKQCMQNHKLLSPNAMKELVLDSLADVRIKIHYSTNIDKLKKENHEYFGERESIFHFDCDGPNTIVHMEETHNYGPPGE